MRKAEHMSQSGALESGKDKRSTAILRYIEQRIIAGNDSAPKEDEADIKKYYAKISAREKAEIIYAKMMAYLFDKQVENRKKRQIEGTSIARRNEDGMIETFNVGGVEGETYTPEPADEYLISELKVLLEDAEAKNIFSETYGSSRTETATIRSSKLGKIWDDTLKELERYNELFTEVERKLNLAQVKGATKISSAEGRKARYGEHIRKLELRKRLFETLGGDAGIVSQIDDEEALAGVDLIKSKENTDVVAKERYSQLLAYRNQLENNSFVWLDSRYDIHKQTVGHLLNGRWPILVGEAGTGKSQQADAAAIELTGQKPTEIACNTSTGEAELIYDPDFDPKEGGFRRYGPLMQAFTGYSDSRQTEPEFKTGRICRLDEFGKLGDKAYAILKKAGQVKAGDDFFGKPVLPGFGIIAATNPAGTRYTKRQETDVAMRREFAEIWVDFPDMDINNPELFEFALVSLLDENGHLNVAKSELGPAYKKVETSEEERQDESKKLSDGSIVLSRQEIIEDMTAKEHGALWRFCAAIKAMQDAFVYGNPTSDNLGFNGDRLLNQQDNDEGKMYVTTDGSGNPLMLSNSVVTLGELESWLSAFNKRKGKKEKEFQVGTLTEWLNLKIREYIKGADTIDKDKLVAIFEYFGFLDDKNIPDISGDRPLTQVEIGYLSPLVPRPLELERPVQEEPKPEDLPNVEAEVVREYKEYETKQVVLESGESVLMKVREFTVHGGTFDVANNAYIDRVVTKGQKLRIDGQDFVYAGVVEDGSEHDGKVVVKFESNDLYRAITEKELDDGMLVYESEKSIEDFKNITAWVERTWKTSCVNNPKNNPENVPAPDFA